MCGGGGWNLKKSFPKIQMPRGFPRGGGLLKLGYDRCRSETFVYLALVLCVHYAVCRFLLTVSCVFGSVIDCFNVNPSAC